MSNVIVPLEHQSSPKETQADKEIRLAATEIAEGKWTPPDQENPDFWQTGTEVLAQHPRVQEALDKLKVQVQDRTSAEYLEYAQQLHELNENAEHSKQWPGQQRWIGKENEQMRVVNPLSPFQFIDKLVAAGISAEKEPTVTREYRFHPLTGLPTLADVENTNALICLGAKVALSAPGQGVCGIYAFVPQKGGGSIYERVSLLQVPAGPEWDLLGFDDYGVPCGKRYHGWRTALLALVQRRVITEEEAIKAFGRPLENPASTFYRQQMAEFRNGQA